MSKLKLTDGTYSPSIFIIHVDAGTTDTSKMNTSELKTYHHEYIHFLQDISTVYGISNTILYYQQIAFYLDFAAKNNKVYDIKMDSIPDAFQEQFFVSDLAQGDSVLKTEEDENCYTIKGYKIDKLSTKILLEHCHTEIELEYSFGGLAILESMAYEISEHIFQLGSPEPRFPYKIAREVADYIVKPILTTQELCLLCEMALMNPFPGKKFVIYLERIKNGESIEVIKNETMQFQTVKDIPLNIAPNYILCSDYFQRAFEGIFNGALRKELRAYVLNIYHNALNHRGTNQFFISQMVSDERIIALAKIKELHTKIGAPNFICGGEYKGANAADAADIEYTPVLLVMGTLFEKILSNEFSVYKCPLLESCKMEATPYLFNENCSVNYFKNAIPGMCPRNPQEYCAGGAVAKNLGLENVIL